jgi:hypothetical protein
MAGRKSEWAGPRGRALVLAVKAARHEGETAIDAIRKIRADPEWSNYSEITLQHKYPMALRHHGDSPVAIVTESGERTSALQKWGMASEEALSARRCPTPWWSGTALRLGSS